MLGLLDPHRLIIDQHVESLPPQALIHIDPKIVEPNLAMLADLARELAEPEDAPEAAGLDQAALGIPEHDLWRQIVQPPLVILPFVGPMPPELVIPHELGMLPIDPLPIGTASHVGIEPPTLDGKAPFGEVLPRVTPGNRGPANAELLQTGAQRQKHPGMITDDGVRRAPLGNRLAADLHHAGEMLAIDAAGPHEGAAIAVTQEDAREPVPVELGQIPHIDEPELVGRCGLLRALVGVREASLSRGRRMGLFLERDHLPDRGVAIPIAQRVSGHLHAVVAQQGIGIQPWEDLHHDLDRHAGGNGGPRPRVGGQPQQPCGGEPAFPIVDHRRLEGEELGDAPGAEANFEQFNEAPAGLLLGRILPIRAKPEEHMCRAQGVGQALGQGAGLTGERALLVRRQRREGSLLRALSTALPRVGGELVPLEHPTDAPVIDGLVIAGPDHLRQFTISAGMGDRQLHNVLLDVTWQERFDGSLPPGVGELTAIDQSQEAMTWKAAPVTPQPPIVEACLAAVLRQCTLPRQDRTNRLIAREGVLIGWRVTRAEVPLESAELSRWHVFLLPSPPHSTSSNRGGIYAELACQISDKPPIPELCRMMRPHPYSRSTDTPAYVVGCTERPMVYRQHAQFVHDYQFWGHWAHTRRDAQGRVYDLAPEVVLGNTKGRAADPSRLRRILRLRQVTRLVRRYGQIRLHHVGLYIDHGRWGQTVEVLVDDEVLRVEQADQLLVVYPCVYDTRQRRVAAVEAEGRQQYHDVQAVQLLLWAFELIRSVWRMPRYYRRPRHQRAHTARQMGLFEPFAE